MDLNSIRDQVSNLTLYDLKAGVRKVQNGELMPQIEVLDVEAHKRFIAVMNYTEMESKVIASAVAGLKNLVDHLAQGPRSHQQ